MAALFLTFLAFLTSAAQARTLSSENWPNKIDIIIGYKRPVPSSPSSPQLSPSVHELTTTNYERTTSTPPPSPKLSPGESQLQTVSPSVAGNPRSTTFLTIENGYGKAKILPPPPPASSKSPTQLENIGGNPCSSFLAMETDYGTKKPSTPPPPASSKSPTESEIDSPTRYPSSNSSSRPFAAMKTDYGKKNLSPPPTPTSAEPPIHTAKTGCPCVIGKAKLSPPPPPASSKSPTESEIDSPGVVCSSMPPFIAIKNDYGRERFSPPPPPASSKSPTESEIDSPCVVCSSMSPFIAIKNDYGRERFSPPPPPASSKSPIQLIGRPSLSAPPPPAASKSPTHSGNIVSPCVSGTANPCSSFISMVTDQDYGSKRSPPPSRKASPPQHFDFTSVEELNHFLRMFI